MKRFTDPFIKGLKPKPQRYFVREDAPRGEGGFGIRVMPTGSKSWQMIYTFEGQRKWLFLGTYPSLGLAQARKLFREKREILASGKDPGEVTRTGSQERRDSWTVDKLCDEYLEKYAAVKKRPRSAHEDKLNLDRDVRKTWGKRKATDIRKSDVIALLDVIVARGSTTQANRSLATIRKMFSWAHEREIVEFNPAAQITKPGKETEKDRALSLDEVKTLWQNLDTTDDLPVGVKTALKVVLLTGCRPGEILAARWDQFKENWLELPGTATKNKKPHRIYLSPPARRLIGKPGEGLIITKGESDQIRPYILSYWVRRCSYFGIPPWTPHDLRRTCATRMEGAPPHIKEMVLNHAAAGITRRVYDQYSYAPEIAAALDQWGRAVEIAVSGKTSKTKRQRSKGSKKNT